MPDLALIHRMGCFVVNSDDPEEVGAVDPWLGDVEGVSFEETPGQLEKPESLIWGFQDLDDAVKLKASVAWSGIGEKE